MPSCVAIEGDDNKIYMSYEFDIYHCSQTLIGYSPGANSAALGLPPTTAPHTSTTEFANVARRISLKDRLRITCYVVSSDPR
jgi:hypothetical protein